MIAKLIEDLHNMYLLIDIKLNSQDLLLLDEQEITALTRARKQTVNLVGTLTIVSIAFYKNKIQLKTKEAEINDDT